MTGTGAGLISPAGRRWLAAASVLLALLLGLVGFNVGGWKDRLFRRAAAPRIQSLAVLPLENLSRAPDQDYFADGMTEALITDLSKIAALRVISRTSAMQYKGVKKPLPQVASELGVDAIIEGSVLREGNRVRITAQLVEARTDRHLWAETYERDLTSVLALQGEVARAIAREIQIKLTPQEEGRFADARLINPEAHEAYLKGRFYWNKYTQEGYRKAIEYFGRAIEADPGYALAYAGLADTYYYMSNIYMAPKEAMPKARAAALKALELDDTLGEAHASLGLVKAQYDWDWAGAEKDYRRAIELNPGYASAHHWYGIDLVQIGRFDEAKTELRLAEQLDPLSLSIAVTAVWPYFFGRDYERAAEQFRNIIAMDPNFPPAHGMLGCIYEQTHHFAQATAEFTKEIQLDNAPGSWTSLAHAYAVSGRKGEAEELARKLVEKSKRHFVASYDIALIYAGLGEKDKALKWLEKAYEDRSEGLLWIKIDPRLDSLRSDPRFQALLRRVGLPP